jgi:hypothetical protein
MSLKGSLATMPPGDLFEWLARRGARGRVSLERGDVRRRFELHEGAIRSARSNVPGEGLGNLLLGRGLVSDAALQAALRAQAEGAGGTLAASLLATGAIGEPVLRLLHEEVIREALCEAVSWTEGGFEFTAGPVEVDIGVAVAIDDALPYALAEAPRRREIRRLLPSDQVHLWVADRAAIPPDRPDLDEVVARVEQGRSVDQIACEAPTRFDALDRIAVLIEAGVLRLERRTRRRARANSDLEPSALGQAARGRAVGGDRAGALELARRAVLGAPDQEDLRILYHSLERALLAELGRELLGQFRIPRLLLNDREQGALELDEVECQLVARIDGRWDLLSLLQIVPLREVEILMACKRLAARGIISL